MSKETLYWTTKDGRKLNVDDMDDNHVRNAFKVLLRKLQNLKNAIDVVVEPYFTDECERLEGTKDGENIKKSYKIKLI